MSEPTTILTVAEVEAMVENHNGRHDYDCDCISILAASHLALWRKCEQAVDDEPEYPGEMPDEMYQAICSRKDVATEAMRITVRLTKQGIKRRMS